MVSVSSFKSSSVQHDVHFVNYGPSYFEIDDKAGDALVRGYHGDKSQLVKPFS